MIVFQRYNAWKIGREGRIMKGESDTVKDLNVLLIQIADRAQSLVVDDCLQFALVVEEIENDDSFQFRKGPIECSSDCTANQ